MPALVDEPRGRLQDAQAVAGGVGALARRRAVVDQREVGHMRDHADCSTGARISRHRSPSRSPRRAASSGSASVPSLVEGAVGHADGQLGLEHVRAGRLERLAHLGLRPDGAEQAGARADHGGGLLLEHVVGERARGPVERVLEPAGDRGVVLRRGDQERVGRLDRVEEVLHGRGRVVLEVLVEDGQAGEAVPLHELDPGRQGVPCRPEQPAVVGAPAHAACDAEDPHGARPAARRARARRSA